MTTKQKRIQLKNLAKAAKNNLYEMIQLADQIVSDYEYVDSMGGEDVVVDALQNDEFSHFGSSFTVRAMIAAYRANPDIKVWRDAKFDIQRMIDLAKPKKESSSEDRSGRNDWKGKCLELQDRVEELEIENAEFRKTIERLTEENAELKREVAELIGELRGLTRNLQTA